MAGGNEGWSDSKLIARAVLHDRASRRKVIARMLIFVLLLMVGGLWVVDGWLAGNVWYFLLWWGAVAFFTFMEMLFALYDVLAVIREERGKHR